NRRQPSFAGAGQAPHVTLRRRPSHCGRTIGSFDIDGEMTMIDLENEVREALTDLANQSRPVNLASSAIHRARVTRRRQVALSGIAVIALIAAIVVPLSRLQPTTDRAPIAGKPAITTVPAR